MATTDSFILRLKHGTVRIYTGTGVEVLASKSLSVLCEARELSHMNQAEINIDTHLLPSVDVKSSSGLCYLERNNVRLALDFEAPYSGESATQLLVLVNGFARPRADFRAFRKRLHAQMPNLASVALDNRGAGETEGGIDSLTVEHMATDAAYVARVYARSLRLDGYHCLGVSMGGMICQQWASGDPQLRSLTLVSTTVGGAGRVWPEGIDSQTVLNKPFEPWPQDFEAMHRRMVRYFGPKFRKASPLLIEIMVKNMLKSHTDGGAQGRARAQYNATVGFDGTQRAAQISCPTLILTGSDDEIIPAANADVLCRLIPQAKKVILPEMGHLLLIEDPENFVAQVRSFLESLPG